MYKLKLTVDYTLVKIVSKTKMWSAMPMKPPKHQPQQLLAKSER